MTGSPAVGRPLRELRLPKDGYLISVILRGSEAVFPSADTVLQAGDAVVAVVSSARERELRELFAP